MRVVVVACLFLLSCGVVFVVGHVMVALFEADASARSPSGAAVQAEALQRGSPAGVSSVQNGQVGSDAAPVEEGSWRQVTFWAGRGDKATEPFVVSVAPWRITWSVKNIQLSGGEQLEIAVLDDRREVMARVEASEGAGIEYVAAGPGLYRIQVSSAGVAWDLAVEEQR
jgi:hypothetical protein